MKVGDYVRYKYENCIYIGKIDFISEVMGFDETLQLEIDNCVEEILKENILKSSSNIIDLIEVGDYVNGSQVVDIAQAPKKALYTENIRQKGALIPIINNEIESIVTKEQFESMEYKVGE